MVIVGDISYVVVRSLEAVALSRERAMHLGWYLQKTGVAAGRRKRQFFRSREERFTSTQEPAAPLTCSWHIKQKMCKAGGKRRCEISRLILPPWGAWGLAVESDREPAGCGEQDMAPCKALG